MTSLYFLGSENNAQPRIDDCGILVTSDVPIPQRSDYVMAINDDKPNLDEPLGVFIDVPNTNGAPRPAELQNAQDRKWVMFSNVIEK